MDTNLQRASRTPVALMASAAGQLSQLSDAEIGRNIRRYFLANQLEFGVSNMIARPIKIKLPFDPDQKNNITIPVEINLTVPKKQVVRKKPAKKPL